MGKVISIINQKGGSGKTTTATNMAVCLADMGYKVLLIDLDGQCNSSFNLGCIDYKNRTNSIIGLLSAILYKNEIPKDYIIHTEYNVDLIPSNSNEFKQLSDSATVKAGGYFLLRKLIKQEKLSEKYDYIIIDNNGYLGSMVQNSILASTDLLIPASASSFDFQGIFELINFVTDIINDDNLNMNEINLNGVLITDDESRTQVSKEIKEQFNSTFENIYFYQNTIPHSQDIRKSQFKGKVLCGMRDKSAAKDAYYNFVKEWIEHENN